MPQFTVNYLAVLIAAVINMAVGFVWYSPALFAKPWMKALGKSPEDLKGAATGPLYMINTVASLILAYVLAHFVKFSGATTALMGLQTGIWAWIGFVITILLPVYLFESRPIKLYFIYISYQLVSFILMGIILAIWV